MKKFLAIAFLICFSALKIFAAGEEIFSGRPGNYAIYHDLRFEEEVIIGLCYVGENAVLARSYEPETQNELLLLVQFTVNDDQIDLGETLNLLKGDLHSSPAASRLLPMIMNWATTWYKSKDKINENTKYSASTDDDYNYLSWIPVFQLDYIGNKKDFTVFSIGLLKDFTDARFFGITKLPEPVESDKYTIKKGKKIDVVIDGLSVPLDSNWVTEDQRVYRITNKTPQDAAFLIETINYPEQGFSSVNELASLLLIGNMDVVLLTDGSSIEYENGLCNINFRMYDPNQNKITVQQTQLIERNDGYVSIATLACYETLYLQNKKYFDKILH